MSNFLKNVFNFDEQNVFNVDACNDNQVVLKRY